MIDDLSQPSENTGVSVFWCICYENTIGNAFTDESNSKLFSHPVTDFPEVLPAYQQFCEIDLRAPVGTPSVAYFLKIESYILDSFFMGVHGGFLTLRCFVDATHTLDVM